MSTNFVDITEHAQEVEQFSRPKLLVIESVQHEDTGGKFGGSTSATIGLVGILINADVIRSETRHDPSIKVRKITTMCTTHSVGADWRAWRPGKHTKNYATECYVI